MVYLNFILFICFWLTASFAEGISLGAASIELPHDISDINNPPVIRLRKEITRHNITWTFSNPLETGQFANGDYWVIDRGNGISIVDIIPPSTDVSGRIRNGSMINPTSLSNGYDNSIAKIPYMPTLNAGRPNEQDLSIKNPLIIHGDTSLVSSKTNETQNKRPQLEDAAVLTVLKAVPPDGSFRPPYAGTDKCPKWNISNIQWNLLPYLPKEQLRHVPDLPLLANKSARVWLDHGGSIWTGRYLHPSNNMPDYGRDMAIITGDISLALLLDYTKIELTPLIINFLQLGIDWFGVTSCNIDIFKTTSQGGLWMGGGGHGHGRKWPMIFAGIILRDNDMLKYSSGKTFPIFQEEQQHFFITEADVNLPRYTADGRPRHPYTYEMMGIAEWGEQHLNQPRRDGANWNAPYREIVSMSILGHALAAQLMNAKEKWGWNAFFEYQQRWVLHRNEIDQPVAYSKFVCEMVSLYWR
jgi:hypothetical protein